MKLVKLGRIIILLALPIVALSLWKFIPLRTIATVEQNNNLKEASQMIPRALLFGNPAVAGVKISPDGQYISYIAPHNGVLNIFVTKTADIGKPDQAVVVTNDSKRGIKNYLWAHDSVHILYSQDEDGDENWHIHCTDILTSTTNDLTPFAGSRNHIAGSSRFNPETIVISTNKRRSDLFDLYTLNISTGEMTLLYQNDAYMDLELHQLELKFGSRMLPDGSVLVEKLQSKNGVWSSEEFIKIPQEDVNTTSLLGFNLDGTKLYAIDSRGANTAALCELDQNTGDKSIIYTNDKADVSNAVFDARTGEIQAVGYEYDMLKYAVLDKEVDPDFVKLQSLGTKTKSESSKSPLNDNSQGEIIISSKTLDDKIWIINYISDCNVDYYIYNRTDSDGLQKIFTTRPELEQFNLSKMDAVSIKARDGLEMISYLTLPNEITAETQDNNPPAGSYQNSKGETVLVKKPAPLVLLVHGGPAARDGWGFNIQHQWLSNRGYAVLSVNYRGSTGYGKAFVNAGYGEWGAKMLTDLTDSVEWAIEHGITTRDKVAIVGGSYGGYAALCGLTMTPDFFACGVDLVGPSSLITLLNSVPPYWEPVKVDFVKMLGADSDTEEGREFLLSRSPIKYSDKIVKPLLIGHGANDPRVKALESDQIVEAMKKNAIPVTYLWFGDEGHGFARPENRTMFFAAVENFLSMYLGGRAEAISPDEINVASVEIRSGGEFLGAFN